MSDDADQQTSMDEIMNGYTGSDGEKEDYSAPDIAGEIPEDWEVVTVEDLNTDLLGGGTPSKSNNEYWDGEIPWASVKDLDGITLSDTEDYITQEGLDGSASNIIPAHSIVISTRMTVGEPFVNRTEMAINQDMKGIIPNNNIVNTYYFVYNLRKKDPYLKSLGRGTTVDGITTSDLKRTCVELPPLTEQRKIASILYNVDKVIEKTEEIINQIFRVKKALTQELFINGYYEHEKLVDAHHRNRLSKHPSEWQTEPAKKVIDVTRGSHPRPKSDKSLWGGEIPMIKIGDRNRGDSRTITSTEDNVTEKGSNDSKLVDEGTLIVSNAGTVGEARITGMQACIHDHWLILRNYEERLNTRYLFHFINWNQEFLEALASGSTVLDLNTDDFRLFDITIPSLDEQKKIADILDRLHDQKTASIKYSEQLERLKDGIMQDLLTGKVRTQHRDINVLPEVEEHG